jgi:hypothetical protein
MSDAGAFAKSGIGRLADVRSIESSASAYSVVLPLGRGGASDRSWPNGAVATTRRDLRALNWLSLPVFRIFERGRSFSGILRSLFTYYVGRERPIKLRDAA